MRADIRRPGVLLVHAPIEDPQPLFRGSPMSILYAAAVLAERVTKGRYAGVGPEDIVLFDPGLHFGGFPEDAVVELGALVRRRKPSLVAIGTTSYAFYWACRMAAEVKLWDPHCAVVIGGPHEDEGGACRPGGAIATYGDAFDFSVQGDGELLLDLLFALLLDVDFDVAAAKKTLASKPALVASLAGSGAICFRYDGELHSAMTGGRFRPGLAMRSRIPLDLDLLPLAPRWLLDEEHKYLFDIFPSANSIRLKRTAQVMTTRGCKFGCSFCTERGAVSCRSVASVLDELHALRDADYESVFFDDSTFHTYEHLADLLLALEAQREELGLEFGCLTRVDSVLAAQAWLPLERFSDAGFTYFYLGLEHDDDAVLNQMHKGYGRDEIHRCLDLFATKTFRLGVSVLFGFEAETAESRRRSLRLVAEHSSIILVNLNVLAYHPAATLIRHSDLELRYDLPAPNRAPEWDLFEEGRWHHPAHVTLEYARAIHQLICEVDTETGGKLVPKLKRRNQLLGPRRERSALAHGRERAGSTPEGETRVQGLSLFPARRCGLLDER
jgi:radical SAM superfamily enzyme YgiQ (UPF0313 family)